MDYLGATKLHQLVGSLCGWQLQLYPRRPAAHPQGFDLCYKRQGERGLFLLDGISHRVAALPAAALEHQD